MKALLSALTLASLLVCGGAQAAVKVDTQVLKEKAAFALGVQKDQISLEESDRTPEPLSVFFNARYQHKLFQCYVATADGIIVSDAVCRPTDGSRLPQ